MPVRRVVAAIVALAFCVRSAAALTPGQIAVIVNSKSPASQQVAEHYIKARGIPQDHLIYVTVIPGDDMSEPDYRLQIVLPIRKALAERKLDGAVTCLVTTTDIPLRIGSQPVNPADELDIIADRKQLAESCEELYKSIPQYNAILAPAAAPVPAPPPAATSTATATAPAAEPMPPLPKILAQLQEAVNHAASRINRATGDARADALAQFVKLQERILGRAGLIATLSALGNTDGADAVATRLQALRDAARDADRRVPVLMAHRAVGHARHDLLLLQLVNRGVVGQAGELEEQLLFMQRDQSEAAVDSELMMLWVDEYSHARWLGNPFNVESFSAIPDVRALPRVMMVARIDGSTPQKTMDMIDSGIRVEQKGLDGTVYFDARGIYANDGYGLFDADLRNAARYMQDHTDMKVVLDDKPELLEAKNCPDCALYCGWYSLRNYHDSCQWLPGCVGYHVASLELATLRDPKETGWCVNLLNRGVCGTLGATSEPYLHAFPRPSLFFPLLVSGQFTQGEVYYLTCPVTSWRIAFLGDPLYNPFKAKPRLAADTLQGHPALRNAARILAAIAALPPTPATQPASAPAR